MPIWPNDLTGGAIQGPGANLGAKTGAIAGAVPQLTLAPRGQEPDDNATLVVGGGLTLLCGPSGGGKTTVIKALLGELSAERAIWDVSVHWPADQDVITTEQRLVALGHATEADKRAVALLADDRRRVAFCPDTPWIVSGTIRKNITYGRGDAPFDESAYWRAVDAVALGPDLDTMSAGDLTKLGNRGTTLSGGQRSRVALARAVYSGAKLCLLDDPLASLDGAVAAHCCDHAILALSAHGATVVVATHTPQQLEGCCGTGNCKRVDIEGGRVLLEGGREGAMVKDQLSRMPSHIPSEGDTEAGETELDMRRSIGQALAPLQTTYKPPTLQVQPLDNFQSVCWYQRSDSLPCVSF